MIGQRIRHYNPCLIIVSALLVVVIALLAFDIWIYRQILEYVFWGVK
jgi:hypothetical protein